MTAWQYLAGAGLVAALCPLQGHVAVADDGDGHAARVDLCVPAGTLRPQPPPAAVRPPASAGTLRPQPPPAAVRPPAQPSVRASARPSVRVTVPRAERPTVHHPGRGPQPLEPVAPVPPGDPKTRAPARAPAPVPGPPADPSPAPPPPWLAAAPVTRFHVRPYHSVALERRGPNGMSTVMLMVVVTMPAVLAAAALRPRGKSRRG
ncbi:hypothetical protein [Streptomyces sp. ISL-86]|uniref:hypothetical protein n=1 Tax=Streptomyces sp. ISL-86 TaxID=2819187 RepID=UPI001BE9DDB1|nr:hypothetical protein [Streptomyces sp. ISL-86]MBT2455462.1 hypothetical protein [Streptomyces sp. ISL-86]